MRKLLTSVLISASMIGAVPAAAVAQTSTSASKLSVVSARAGAQSGGEKLADGAGGIIAIALLALELFYYSVTTAHYG